MKATSKGRIKIILKGSALVLWCVVIFMFSANNADESNKQSNAVFNAVIEFVNPVYDSLDLTGIDTNNIAAEYKNGILTLDLPKMQEVKPETKRLEIK